MKKKLICVLTLVFMLATIGSVSARSINTLVPSRGVDFCHDCGSGDTYRTSEVEYLEYATVPADKHCFFCQQTLPYEHSLYYKLLGYDIHCNNCGSIFQSRYNTFERYCDFTM